MILKGLALFLTGLFLANGIPHFVNGISGKDFHSPSLYRFVPGVPSPLFNVIWGLLNFCLAIGLLVFAEAGSIVIHPEFVLFALGFVFASIGLSVYFDRRSKVSAA